MPPHLLNSTAVLRGPVEQQNIGAGISDEGPDLVVDETGWGASNAQNADPSLPGFGNANAKSPGEACPDAPYLEAFLKGRALVGVRDIITGTGLGRTTIYEEIWAGRLTARKLGRRTVFRSDDVRAWLEQLPIFNSNPTN